MSTEEKMKATAKNIEGKAQEAMGEITGDPEDKLEGRSKQSEANVRHSVENVKDDSMENRMKATAKNIEGKAQEFIGEITGDPKDKAQGKAKQVEAQVRHSVENVKDKFRGK